MNSVTSPPALPRTPIVSDHLLKEHNCFLETDSRFRRAARLLQTLWLKDHNIEPGVHIRGEGSAAVVMPLHSNLSRAAADKGLNFLNQDIHAFVRKSLILAEDGACLDTERLFMNAVSSTPAVWNFLAPLCLNPDLATSVFRILFPAFIDTVEHITFETAPLGRRDPRGISDRTAYDAAVYGRAPDGRAVSIFWEWKYTEEFPANLPEHKFSYDEISRTCGLFVDPDSKMLRGNALHQYWRELMLAQRIVDHGQTERAMLVAIAPRLNRSMQASFRAFENELLHADHRAEDRVSFAPLTMEKFIEAIRLAGDADLADALYARYCDFERIYLLALRDATSNIEPALLSMLSQQTSSTSSLIPSKKAVRTLSAPKKSSRLKVSAR